MQNKRVSVIISEYNTDRRLLRNSIKSIVEQTYDNIEIIIVNDDSTNNIRSITKEFKTNKIRIIDNDSNIGLAASLNKAIKASSGYYVARMDTDDYSYKHRIEEQVKFLEEHKDIDVVCGSVDYYDDKNIWGHSSRQEGVITKEQMLSMPPISHPTILGKKEAFIKSGLYPIYNRCEDFALWINMYISGYKIYKMKETVLRYHLSKNDYKKRTLKTRFGLIKLIFNDYQKLNPSIAQTIKLLLKTIAAGIIPGSIMYTYHKRKFNK